MQTRLALRVLKLKAERANKTREAAAIERLLRDRDLLQIFNEYIQSEFYGSPIDLLDWIKENWEEILVAIMKIVDLFSKD